MDRRAKPPTRTQRITTALNAARGREYTDLAAAAEAAARAGEDTAQLPALRLRLREITRRDYFSAPGREAAEAALRGLQDRAPVTGPAARR